MAFVQERHKPGHLKQQNKGHKHGRHRSKGELDRQQKGRVDVKVLTKKVKQLTSKTNRRNQARQMREKKRNEILEEKRKIGKHGAPHVVTIIPLSSKCDPMKALDVLASSEEDSSVYKSASSTTLVSVELKMRFTFLTPRYGDVHATIESGKVSDTIVFLMSATDPVDDIGQKIMSCVLAQGMPTPFHVVQNLEDVPMKKRNDVKKNIHKIIEKRFPKEKLYSLSTNQEGVIILRLISNLKQRRVLYRDLRPYVLAQDVNWEPSDSENQVNGRLLVSGFVRGKCLSVNRLVHLSGFGDFQMEQIDAPKEPFPWNLNKRKDKKDKMDTDGGAEEEVMEEDLKIIGKAEPSEQESLQSEVIPDPMEGEQTWPTDEELREAEESLHNSQTKKVTKKVAKGTSDYQAAWIINEEEEEEEDEENEDDEDEDVDMDEDLMSESASESEEEDDKGDEEFETISVMTETDDVRYDEKLDIDEERMQLEKLKAERENELFPDEIDTPMDVPARTRFQKYRGLKSFRTSPWDPKENLPSDYARIFQFENFNRTKKRVVSEENDDGAMPGWYVTVHIKNVPKDFMDQYDPKQPLVIFGLLPHEQKMSVVHYVIKKHPDFTEPVKTKERLIFSCGYRRFSACPVFSQHTRGDKFKSERFLLKEGVTVASVYAPIMFPPSPVLVFRENEHTGEHSLVASGSLYKVDPNRIVTKKIVLSGHPFKINKRSAVIRYMFFNREDISWFKPVEIWTKHGRRGHIKEPLGTHGHMKCSFDGQLKAQDTVCMSLYKRVFPKWSYDPIVPKAPVIQSTTAGQTDEVMME